MKKQTCFGSQFALAFIVALTMFSGSLPQAEAAEARERKFEFEYKATVKDIPTGAKKVDIWLPVPHDNSFQTITDLRIESPVPYETHTSTYGNKLIYISLNNPQQSSLT